MSRALGNRSIRFRITALATLVVLCVLALAGLALVVVQRRVLIESLTESLERRADELAASVAAGRQPDELVGVGDDDAYVLVTAADGSVVWAAPPDTVVDRRAGSFREVVRLVESPGGQRRVVVAGPLDDIDEATWVLALSLAVATPVVVAVVAILIWWLVGRTLRPVEAIRAEVAGITGSELHRRVPTPNSGDEIEALARTMNDMLERIHDATARQQRFVADASHELRSPLTRMRTQLEVELAHPNPADNSAVERSVLEETIRMHHLVDDLLYLARTDSDEREPTITDPVDLDDLVLEHARRLRAESRAAIVASDVSPARVRGDARALSRAVGNVADNAVRYAASTVTFGLGISDGSAELTISDDGRGVPREERDRIFERFARVDDARASATGGTGLGLSIARDIVERHGGTIELDPAGSGGARFVIRLPTPTAE
jgi:signal transduction histidine kinase